ncbi:MAG: hypothetical protein ACRDQ2_13785, partial [Gaiellales bacterium]
MRALIVVAADHYVRSVIEPGTFQQLDPSDTHYAISTSGVTRQQSVAAVRAASATALRAVSESRGRRKAYANLQLLLLYALRRRSKTMAAKIRS